MTAAAEAEMDDDAALREQLLEAEMRRESGEITDEQFDEIEADLLSRIREIRERRQGGSGPLTLGGAQPIDLSGDSRRARSRRASRAIFMSTPMRRTPRSSRPRPVTKSRCRFSNLTPGQAEGAPQPGLPPSARSRYEPQPRTRRTTANEPERPRTRRRTSRS